MAILIRITENVIQFLAYLYECTGRAIALPWASALVAAVLASGSISGDSGSGIRVRILLKCKNFHVKVFYMMDKTLMGVFHMQTGLLNLTQMRLSILRSWPQFSRL